MANRQDMVFVRPPGIESGGFELRPDNVWYCKLLLLFSVESKLDSSIRRFDCAFISLLEEYNGSKTPGVLIYYVEYAKYAIFVQYDEYVLFVRFVKYACFTYSTYVAYLQSG